MAILLLASSGCGGPEPAESSIRRVTPTRPWEVTQESQGEPIPAPDKAVEFWRARTGGEVWSNPVAPEAGPVIFGSDDRQIYALDSRDGTKRWTARAEGRVRQAPILSRDLALVVDELGWIYALIADTGEQRWTQKLDPRAVEAWAADDRRLIHGGSQRRLVARDPASGSMRWAYELPADDAGVRAASLGPKRVFLVTQGGNIRALNAADGAPRWLAELSLDTRSAPKMVGSNLLLVGNGFLWCLDAHTGQEKWRALTHEFVSASPEIVRHPGLGPRVLVSGGDTLFAFDLKGRELWRRPLEGSFRSGPRGFGELVLVGSGEHLLSAYDLEQGIERWRFETDAFITGALSVYGHPIHGNRVLFGGVDGALYGVTLPSSAFDPPQPIERRPEIRVGPTFFDGTPQIRWSRALGSALAPPTLDGDRILVHHQRRLSNLDLNSGETLWTKNLSSAPRSTRARPVVSREHNLVAVAVGGDLQAFALDNGAELWKAPKPGAPTRLKAQSLVVAEHLFVGTADGRAVAFDPATGSRLWSRSLGGPITGAPAAEDGVVFFGTTTARIVALDAGTGRELWSTKTSAAVAAGPHFENDTLYAGDAGGKVYALEPAVGGSRWTSSIGTGFRLDPTTHFGAVFLCGDDGNLSAVDALTGAEAWRLNIGHRCTGAPEAYDGIVYAGSQNNSLHAVNAVNGEELWRLHMSSPVVGSPIGIDRNGRHLVVTADRNGSVIAVELP